MKKILTLISVSILVLAFSAVSFAGQDWQKDRKRNGRELSPQRKSEMVEYMGKKIQITEDFLQAQVKAGIMPQQSADARIVLMKQRLDNFLAGRPQLTDEQKAARRAARQEYRQKMSALRTDAVKKAMETGSLSQERGERILKKMEEKNQEGYNGRRGGYGKRGHDYKRGGFDRHNDNRRGN